MATDYFIEARVYRPEVEKTVAHILSKIFCLNAVVYCRKGAAPRRLETVEEACTSVLTAKEYWSHGVTVQVDGTQFYLSFRFNLGVLVAVAFSSFLDSWKRDFYFLGEQLDLAHYTRFMLQLMADIPVDGLETGAIDMDGAFVCGSRSDSFPIIELNPAHAVNMYLETLEDIIATGASHGITFLDEKYTVSKDPSKLGHVLFRNISEKGSMKVAAFYKTLPITLYFKDIEDELFIALVPEHPFKMKTYGEGERIDASFYINLALGLTENFWLASIKARGWNQLG